MQYIKLLPLVWLLILTLNSVTVFCNSKNHVHQTMFAPCRACKTFVEAFRREMEKTKKGKFEGGDAAWEEEKLGSYANSEIRLVEIQENVCSDVEDGKDQCYSMHEKYDSVLEEWWFNYQNEKPDLYQYFCIDMTKQCCPEMHFGTNCTPCPGFPDNVCSNNGKCKGAGTRKGSGKCSCDPGYDGPMCETCATSYYEAYQDDKKLLCSKCHSSCNGACTKAGPAGCEKCVSGWLMNSEQGCTDINECVINKDSCSPLQFCVNTEGSHKCLDCDPSCVGCTGDGPDMCISCANGFTFVNNVCVDSEQEQRKMHMWITRYLTYLGLCIATCIILQRNVALAAIIGLAVGIYISVSEYMLNTYPTPNTTDLLENLQQSMN